MKRILLADDSAVVRRSLRLVFEQAGCTVCGEASNGHEAIALAEELKPHLIVLDLAMPVMNGLTAGTVLREMLPATPLILSTSFGNLFNRDDLKRAGFSAIIGKGDSGKLLMTAQTLVNDVLS